MTADLAPGIERAFALGSVEGDGPAILIDGALPEALSGTAFWNGPGQFVRGGLRYRHWLDGDGLISSLNLGGAPRFSSRFVRSTKRTEEEEAGRALYRAFGTRFDGDRLQLGLGLASPVNVSVYPFADTLLAFGEQGLPWSLDASTLATLGEHTFGNALNAVSPFSAHPCFDRSSGEMFAFGVPFAAAAPLVQLYCFDAQGRLSRRARVPLPYACTIHDFGISPEFAIFYVSPYVLDAAALLGDGASVREALRWQPELGSRLLIVRRSDFTRVGEVPLGERYCLHMINAFDQNGELVIDVVELDRPVYDQYEVIPDLFSEVARGRPVRMRVDPAAADGPRLLARTGSTTIERPTFPVWRPRMRCGVREVLDAGNLLDRYAGPEVLRRSWWRSIGAMESPAYRAAGASSRERAWWQDCGRLFVHSRPGVRCRARRQRNAGLRRRRRRAGPIARCACRTPSRRCSTAYGRPALCVRLLGCRRPIARRSSCASTLTSWRCCRGLRVALEEENLRAPAERGPYIAERLPVGVASILLVDSTCEHFVTEVCAGDLVLAPRPAAPSGR